MISPALSKPPVMLMGFHYTPQFSRRTRVVVMVLVDQTTERWARWYQAMHEPAAVADIADAGYDLVEIHFMYGFGPRHEAEDLALTTQFVQHAHEAGLKVLGYFQFFSVQQETFFLEHPWAKDCVQLKADGTPRNYRYDRPALCFSHERVRQYYLDGIELGLRECDLDGIRLDNDYYLGCYCDTCQTAFRSWLDETFDTAATRRVFGLATTAGMALAPPESRTTDPLHLATALFRQHQRQEMMRLISQKVQAVKPGAILGGNPAISRRPNAASTTHVYQPDLGETHHLVCAENDLFPGREGDGIRSQVVAYKHGQANDYCVFASHHLHGVGESLRWPETAGECALSLCEALAFGGHVPCTTWGLRMDGDEDGALYQRPVFMEALRPVTAFVHAHGDLYQQAAGDARVGIYVNRESLSGNVPNACVAFYGTVEALMTHQVPFCFIDRDEQALDKLDLLIVPEMRFVSDAQVERLRQFAENHQLLLLGDACRADEWMLARDDQACKALHDCAGCRHVELNLPDVDPTALFHRLPRLLEAETIADIASAHSPYQVDASSTVALDTTRLPDGRRCLHLLNFDNKPVTVTLRELPGTPRVLAPEDFGADAVECDGDVCILHHLRTYTVLILE